MPRPKYLFRELLARKRLDARFLYVGAAHTTRISDWRSSAAQSAVLLLGCKKLKL
jgi:hypothetical protein